MPDPSDEPVDHGATPTEHHPIPYAAWSALGRRHTDWFSIGSFLCGVLAPFAAGVVAFTIERQRMQPERFIPYINTTFGALVAAALVLGLIGRWRINHSAGRLTGETWGLLGIGLSVGWMIVVGLAIYMLRPP